MRQILYWLLLGVLAGCFNHTSSVNTSIFEADLVPMSPDDSLSMRWSPKAESLPLEPVNGGLEAALSLGPEGTPIVSVRLEQSPGQPHFDLLFLDLNRNDVFDEQELKTQPREIRHRIWSSFDTVIDIPVPDLATGDTINNPYGLSLWYVVDPRVEDEAPALRYTRTGWMQGVVSIGDTTAHILLTEHRVDGIFTQEDSWALALPDSAHQLYDVTYASSAGEHAWLGEKVYKLSSINPSGRHVTIVRFDPGMTRKEEIIINDKLAVDRNAPRSGRTIAFDFDFESAYNRARAENKLLFIDFETTWCGPCKTMDQWVYTADAVVDAAGNVVSVKVDGDEELDLVTRFDVTAYPTLLLVNSQDEVVRRLEGYQGVVEMTEFLTIYHQER